MLSRQKVASIIEKENCAVHVYVYEICIYYELSNFMCIAHSGLQIFDVEQNEPLATTNLAMLLRLESNRPPGLNLAGMLRLYPTIKPPRFYPISYKNPL